MELDATPPSNEYERPIGPPTLKQAKKQAARAKSAAKQTRRAIRREAMSGVVMSSTSGIKKNEKPKKESAQSLIKKSKRVTSWSVKDGVSVADGVREEEMILFPLPALSIRDNGARTTSAEATPAKKEKPSRAEKKVDKKHRAWLAAADALVVRVEMEREQKDKEEREQQRSRKGEGLDEELAVLEKEQKEYAERLEKRMGEIKDEARKTRRRRTPTAVKDDVEVDDLAAMLGLVGMGRKHGK
jgi:hypothetical protein